MPKSLPDWGETLLTEFDAHHTDGRKPRLSIAVNFDDQLYKIVKDAAEARDMSLTAFLRRAALAIATVDQGLDWQTIMQDEPAIAPFVQGGARTGQRKAGFGNGPWKIEGLTEHVHRD